MWNLLGDLLQDEERDPNELRDTFQEQFSGLNSLDRGYISQELANVPLTTGGDTGSTTHMVMDDLARIFDVRHEIMKRYYENIRRYPIILRGWAADTNKRPIPALTNPAPPPIMLPPEKPDWSLPPVEEVLPPVEVEAAPAPGINFEEEVSKRYPDEEIDVLTRDIFTQNREVMQRQTRRIREEETLRKQRKKEARRRRFDPSKYENGEAKNPMLAAAVDDTSKGCYDGTLIPKEFKGEIATPQQAVGRVVTILNAQGPGRFSAY